MTQPLLAVTGIQRSAADVQLPSLVYGWPVLCPLSHGEVLAVDAEEARRKRGVLAVLTADQPLAGSAARFSGLLKGLLSPSVEHAGQVVALVLAETRQLARDAAAIVSLRMRAKKAVVTVAAALSAGLSEPPVRLSSGQSAESLMGASHRFKQTYRTAPRLLGSVASGVATALWRGDALTVYSVGQPKAELATLLAVPDDKLLTVTSSVGADFGTARTESLLAAIASAHLDRPVRVELPPLADCGIVAETVQTLQLGLDPQDRPLSLLLHGAVGESSVGSADGVSAVMDLAAAYGFANRELSMVPLRLHLPTGLLASRHYGWPDLTFSVELAIDEMAERLGVEPLLLRLRWLAEQSTGDGAMLLGCLKELQKRIGPGIAPEAKRSSERAATDLGVSLRRGSGVACAVHRLPSGKTFYGAHFVEASFIEGRIELLRHVCVLSVGQALPRQEAESTVGRALTQARKLALQAELPMNGHTGWTAWTGDDGARSSAVRQGEVVFVSLLSDETVILSAEDLAGLAKNGVAAAVACAVSAALGMRVRTVPPVSRASASGPR